MRAIGGAGRASLGRVYDLRTIVKANDIRGLLGSQLDATVARALGSAFARVVLLPPLAGEPREPREPSQREDQRPGQVVIGYDMRASSPELAAAFADGVTGEGGDVLMIGLCSTDGLYYASGVLDSPAVMFTASHNPASYNGLKLCRSGARPIGLANGLAEIRDTAQAILELLAEGAGPERPRGRRGEVSAHDTLAGYARHLRDLVPALDQRPLKIVADAGNGMAGLTVPAVLGTSAGLPELPIEIVPLYFDLDGTFPNHEPNPLDPDNLRDLQKAVITHGADLGLAFDGDADRCFVIDENGMTVSPSAITALVAAREIVKDRAAGRHPSVIYNLITSRTVPEVIEQHAATAIRTKVGHAFIKVEMAKADAVFGGEHSAHYYFRDFWFADTGMLAALHVLAALGEQSGPLSALVAQYERYAASGEINSEVSDAGAAIERVTGAFQQRPGISIDRLDGLTVSHEHDAPDGDGSYPGLWWFNLRASNTEPYLRLNAEAAEQSVMEHLRDEVLALIRT